MAFSEYFIHDSKLQCMFGFQFYGLTFAIFFLMMFDSPLNLVGRINFKNKLGLGRSKINYYFCI